MSNLEPSVIPFESGLDLHSPKLIAKPGSMLDCLNYEVTNVAGYRRISGFSPYDGNLSLRDFSSLKVYEVTVQSSFFGATVYTNKALLDSDGNFVGYLLRGEYDNRGSILIKAFIRVILPFGFTGQIATLEGTAQTVTLTPRIELPIIPGPVESTLTMTELRTFEDYLRTSPVAPRERPVGLHWHRDNLYAAIPLQVVYYEASDTNVTVDWVVGDALTTTKSAATATILDKIVTTAAAVGVQEAGYFIVRDLDTGSWEHTSGAATLGGGTSVSAGTVNHEFDSTGDYDPCSLWKAERPATLFVNKSYVTPGWTELSDTFTATVTLSGITTAFRSLVLQNTEAESTYYFESSAGNSVAAVLIDYFIVSGSFAAGDAVVRLQFKTPTLNAGVHELEVTTADDMYGEAATTTKLGDITVRQSYNYLPGEKALTEVSSAYQWVSSNFYAVDDMDAFFGATGASRAFMCKGDYFSFIYTQDDSTLDIPRHITAHALHLALGFQRGSVMLSVVGEPTNFDGASGASEIGTGDTITGLLPLSGTVLGVFCNSSIWGIAGTGVSNFSLQIIAPSTGCLEYTLANCGQIVFMDNYGITTLETSERYGDFIGSRLSVPVGPWITSRCRRNAPGYATSVGVVCAIPVRSKNQYRVFFGDGAILTMTFLPQGEQPVAFTFQKYTIDMDDVDDSSNVLVPYAWTSQVDTSGAERIFIVNNNILTEEAHDEVFELEVGNSFSGQYIPHYFTTNWYFGDAPITYMGIQKLRLHGLSRGEANLSVYAAGIQNDYSFGQNEFTTTAESINLPRTPGNIYNDLLPCTNICNLANRGLGVQLKFKGSNTDLTQPEPTHVCQVMVVYARPGGGPDA